MCVTLKLANLKLILPAHFATTNRQLTDSLITKIEVIQLLKKIATSKTTSKYSKILIALPMLVCMKNTVLKACLRQLQHLALPHAVLASRHTLVLHARWFVWGQPISHLVTVAQFL